MTTRFKRTGKHSVRPNASGMHQNKFGFKHNPHSALTKKILAIPNFGLCTKCTEIIEWRKQYRKYKPIKEPKKCTYCKERRVLFAYHLSCQDCAQEKKVCPKCLECNKELTELASAEGEFDDIDPNMLKGMKERDRRALRRMMEEGEISFADIDPSHKNLRVNILADQVNQDVEEDEFDEDEDEAEEEEEDEEEN